MIPATVNDNGWRAREPRWRKNQRNGSKITWRPKPECKTDIVYGYNVKRQLETLLCV